MEEPCPGRQLVSVAHVLVYHRGIDSEVAELAELALGEVREILLLGVGGVEELSEVVEAEQAVTGVLGRLAVVLLQAVLDVPEAVVGPVAGADDGDCVAELVDGRCGLKEVNTNTVLHVEGLVVGGVLDSNVPARDDLVTAARNFRALLAHGLRGLALGGGRVRRPRTLNREVGTRCEQQKAQKNSEHSTYAEEVRTGSAVHDDPPSKALRTVRSVFWIPSLSETGDVAVKDITTSPVLGSTFKLFKTYILSMCT